MDWNMLGHDWAVHLLAGHLAQDRLRHAYLITGPTGVGRRTLAVRLAQAINCLAPPEPGVPCLKCKPCRQIGLGQHPDFQIVEAEPGGPLKVEQVRELQRSLMLMPREAAARVALLLRFEEANPNAANALLKTLEEPPPRVVLILTAVDAEALLPTIVSRCEAVRLRPLPLETLTAGLQTRWGLPLEQAEVLAHLSGGRPGYALRLHENPAHLEKRQAWLDDHQRLLHASRVERFAYAEALAKDKQQTGAVIQVWLSYWRDVFLKAAGAAAPPTNLDRAHEIEQAAARFSLPVARRMLETLDHALVLLDKNINIRLTVEVLMLDLPRVG